MKKYIKSFAFASVAAFVLNACADSASINQQAASSYAQEMGRIRTQGAVDTTSPNGKTYSPNFQQNGALR